MTRKIQLEKYSNSTIAKYGLAAGFVAVIIMTVFILAMDAMIGLPPDAFFTMIGLAMGISMNQASALGGVIHIVMGTVFGAITGVVANSIPYFRNKFIGKGTRQSSCTWPVVRDSSVCHCLRAAPYPTDASGHDDPARHYEPQCIPKRDRRTSAIPTTPLPRRRTGPPLALRRYLRHS